MWRGRLVSLTALCSVMSTSSIREHGLSLFLGHDDELLLHEPLITLLYMTLETAEETQSYKLYMNWIEYLYFNFHQACNHNAL